MKQALGAIGIALSFVVLITACVVVNLALSGDLGLTLPWAGPTCLRCW